MKLTPLAGLMLGLAFAPVTWGQTTAGTSVAPDPASQPKEDAQTKALREQLLRETAARKAEVERAEQLLRPGRKSSAGLARRASDAFSRRASIAATLSNAAWNRFSAHRRQSVLKRSVLNAFASAGTTKVAGSESPQDTGSTGIAPAPTILKRSLLQAVIASAAAMKAAETATITISESPPAADEVIGVGAAVPVVDAHVSGRQTGGVIAPALREERALRVAKSRRMVAKR